MRTIEDIFREIERAEPYTVDELRDAIGDVRIKYRKDIPAQYDLSDLYDIAIKNQWLYEDKIRPRRYHVRVEQPKEDEALQPV